MGKAVNRQKLTAEMLDNLPASEKRAVTWLRSHMAEREARTAKASAFTDYLKKNPVTYKTEYGFGGPRKVGNRDQRLAEFLGRKAPAKTTNASSMAASIVDAQSRDAFNVSNRQAIGEYDTRAKFGGRPDYTKFTDVPIEGSKNVWRYSYDPVSGGMQRYIPVNTRGGFGKFVTGKLLPAAALAFGVYGLTGGAAAGAAKGAASGIKYGPVNSIWGPAGGGLKATSAMGAITSGQAAKAGLLATGVKPGGFSILDGLNAAKSAASTTTTATSKAASKGIGATVKKGASTALNYIKDNPLSAASLALTAAGSVAGAAALGNVEGGSGNAPDVPTVPTVPTAPTVPGLPTSQEPDQFRTSFTQEGGERNQERRLDISETDRRSEAALERRRRLARNLRDRGGTGTRSGTIGTTVRGLLD